MTVVVTLDSSARTVPRARLKSDRPAAISGYVIHAT